MKCKKSITIIGMNALILVVVVALMMGCNAEQEVKFERVFNSISYFGNTSPNDIVELNANEVYIFDTQQQWGAFKERYLKGESIRSINLLENEKIMFIHTKWEDVNWGTSYYIESMSVKDKQLNITINENGTIERIAGFPEDTWIHSILIYKVDGKNVTNNISINLIIEE
ncbi:MAG: hypothetical protein KMY55_04955 [Dethiosulfatibacter sp.]|nr:hypothetical protein [Dethiosulfatibacter sp.]